MKTFRASLGAIFLGIIVPTADVHGSGNWLKLANSAPDSVGFTLLLSDGTVIAANNPTSTVGAIGNDWYRLTPDENGHYVNGTWSRIASMHYSRLFYSSQVLTNGTVWIAGGEHPDDANSATSEIYDPIANTWTLVNPPAALMDPTQLSPVVTNLFQSFEDSISEMLPNGDVLVAPVAPANYGGTLIYDVATSTWSNGPVLANHVAYQDEATWVKLPDDSILTIDPFGTNCERYIPAINQWIPDTNVPVAMYSVVGGEMGAGFLLPNGKAFFLGASGHTAIYTPTGTTNPGTWVAGPDIPDGNVAADAPAAMMPNGKILCAVASPPFLDGSGNEQFPSPTSFYEYDYTSGATGAFTRVSGPTGDTDDISSYQSAMLALPDGSVLYNHFEQDNLFYSSFGSQLYVYVPDGSQVTSGDPAITSITPNADGSFTLTGTGLNGLSQGAAYGDDVQMNDNYPIVMFTDTNTGHVDYARSFNWNCTGVRTGGKVVTTQFTLPAGLLPQNYLVQVSAAGITSAPVLFSFVNPSSLALCPGGSGSLSVTTSPQPASYQWYQNGMLIPFQTGATLSITNANTNQSGLYTLKVTSSSGGSSISTAVPVSVGVWEISQPPVTNSALVCYPTNLSVVARGHGTLSAQWFHNADLIVPDSRVTETTNVQNGATTFSLSFTNVVYQDDATYHIVITDDCGTVSEPLFAMRVTPNPPWVTVGTKGPGSRYWSAMAYDSDRGVTVLFGGQIITNTGVPVLNDTWEWNGTNWNQRFPATSPSPRSQSRMEYDSRRHKMVLFGGRIFTNSQYNIVQETWEWDATNWQRINTPNVPPWTQPDLFASCYDSARGEMLIFGGLESSGRVFQLWGYNGSNWSQKLPSGPTPVDQSPVMTFDSKRNVAVLLGGASQSVPTPYAAASVWEWDGAIWRERTQGGQVFGGANAQDMLVFDSFRGESVIYGDVFGVVDGVIPNPPAYSYPDDVRFVWRWNGQQWQADPPTPTPGATNLQVYGNMVFDSQRNGILLFGGEDGGNQTVTNNTYEILYQAAPAILSQPTMQVAFLGQTVQISVLAAAAQPVIYSWSLNGFLLGGPTNISGGGTTTLTINSAGPEDAGTYQMFAGNHCGLTASDPITLTVSAGTLVIGIVGSHVQVSWNNPSATLQSAPAVTGPWSSLVGTNSPYNVLSPTNHTYFRLVE